MDVFHATLEELREDYAGQPRDAHGRFSSNIAGAGRSRRKSAEGGEDLPTPPKPLTPDETWKAAQGKLLAAGGIALGTAGAIGGAAAIYGLATMNRYTDEKKEGPEVKSNPASQPKPEDEEKRQDAFEFVISALRQDFEEQKHPRDAKGRFAKKGSSRGSTLMSAAPGGVTPEVTPPAAGGGAEKPDELEGLTIRELKELARKHQVNGYSNMTKEQLKDGIKTAKDNPQQQERIRKTLNKKAETRKIIGSNRAAKYLKEWEGFKKLVSAAGVAPELVAIAIAAKATQMGVTEWKKQQAEYAEHLDDSARDAEVRARTTSVRDMSDKPHLVVAVGGNKGLGSTASAITKGLAEGESEDTEWFKENGNFLEIENDEYDIKTLMPEKIGGITNPAWQAEVLLKGGGNMLKQRARKRNEQSVEIAAQLYAHLVARQVGESNGSLKRVNKDLPITIVTHGTGGAAVDEAVAILKKMKLKDASPGIDFVDQIQVVKLGSSSVGLLSKEKIDGKKPVPSRTFTSSNDPFSMLPKRNEKWMQGVKGGGVEDYLSSESVRQELLNVMGADPDTYRVVKGKVDARRKAKEQEERFKKKAEEDKANKENPPHPPPPKPPRPSSKPGSKQEKPKDPPPPPADDAGPQQSDAPKGKPDDRRPPKRGSSSDYARGKGRTPKPQSPPADSSKPHREGDWEWLPEDGESGGYWRLAFNNDRLDTFSAVLMELRHG